MANEIAVSFQVTVTKGEYNRAINDSLSLTQNSQGAVENIVATSTAAANFAMGGLTTANQGFVYVRNLDLTNNIDVGYDASGSFVGIITLKPGETGFFRAKASLQLQHKAQAGTPNLQYVIWRD